jgi:hypothetical protein
MRLMDALTFIKAGDSVKSVNKLNAANAGPALSGRRRSGSCQWENSMFYKFT